MQSYIKWFVMFLGGFRFGAGGAIIGFFVGYIIEEIIKGEFKFEPSKAFQKEDNPETFNAYQQNLLQLLAAMLRADGYISKEKIKYTKHYVYKQFDPAKADAMMRTLNELVAEYVHADRYAYNLANAIGRTRKIHVITVLHEMAMLTGYLDYAERLLLQGISVKIGLDFSDYERILSSFKRKKTAYIPAIDKAYKRLGLTEEASDDEIKKAYRKMVLQYHPDRLEKPTKEDDLAFDTLQKAYEKIKKVRNIK